MSRKSESARIDIYARITERIIADLEKGVRPWVQPWSAGNMAGRITRPLRHNGQPYTGLNVLLLWSESIACGFISATWMTLRQANELGAHVHGAATLQVAVDAQTLTLDFSSPLDNLIGFEHPPRDDKQKAAVKAMADRLNHADGLFVATAEAQCALQSVKL